jgi:hypothetical protein
LQNNRGIPGATSDCHAPQELPGFVRRIGNPNLRRRQCSLSLLSLSQNKSCKEHPRLIGPCFKVHGRLSYYNGAPSLRLWPVGTHRLLGISEGRFALPGYDSVPSAVIDRLASFENEMFADFTVCPFTTDEPGVMRLVCIKTARNILVRTRE